ncbi:Mss4-like protein [Schizophyllum amplum]|uniref:Mss4-like protein n=1 Tax=Schizophyllum amplum TaxID=97359 RepID=A0A550BWV5_9AGAR|nr:Mss4-like protein [Auriculariopsis ampla]
MPTGGCFCGALRYAYTGDAAVKAICHCTDCRKISGTTYSTNIILPADATLTLTTGTPKTYSCLTGSGKPIDNTFCGDCGSTIWREVDGVRAIKAGTLDDIHAIDAMMPDVELFVPRRAVWVPEVQGAVQKEGM